MASRRHCQRAVKYCWAQTVRNILDKMRGANQPAIKAGLHAIMNAKTLPKARVAARRFADRWEAEHEKAVRCLRDDLDEPLTCWCYPTLEQRKRFRTTNAIERHFREVRRRTRPMGVFQDRTSMDRILFAVFTHENANQGVPTLFSLTQAGSSRYSSMGIRSSRAWRGVRPTWATSGSV
jgi:transposase-like protein